MNVDQLQFHGQGLSQFKVTTLTGLNFELDAVFVGCRSRIRFLTLEQNKMSSTGYFPQIFRNSSRTLKPKNIIGKNDESKRILKMFPEEVFIAMTEALHSAKY